MIKIFTSLALSVCLATVVNAQSFDCKKAQAFSEKAICNSRTLSAMDSQLAEIFKSARSKAGNSDVFKTIARGNFALRNQCKDQECVRKWLVNSITLYQYLFEIIPSDNLADYPKEVQMRCKKQETTVDMLDCADAQLNYQQGILNFHIQELLKTAKSEKQKKLVQNFYDQWKTDRMKYCTLEFSGGTKDSLNISGCFLSWTEDLCRKTEDAEEFLRGLSSSHITDESIVKDSIQNMQ